MGIILVPGFTTGSDKKSGTSADEEFRALAGNDTVYAGGGTDILYGDEGNDKLYGEAGFDILYDGAGNDLFDGGLDGDLFIGLGAGSGKDTFDGGAGNDTFWLASPGEVAGMKVTLNGTSNGTLTMTGLNGVQDTNVIKNIEWIYGSNGKDTMAGDSFGNTFISGLGADSLVGGAGNDLLAGNEGNDTINGGDHNDTIEGHEGDDKMNGGSGNDIVKARGGGNDTMTGGSGSDIFQFDWRSSDTGFDRVTDFGSGDVIEFVGDLANGQPMPTFQNLRIGEDIGSGFAVVLFTDFNNVGIILEGVTKAQVDASDFLFSLEDYN